MVKHDAHQKWEDRVFRFLPALVLLAVLTGCLAMTPREIRATAPEVYESTATVDATMMCVRTNQPQLVEVSSYPGAGFIELIVENGGRVHYMATAEPTPIGSRISIRSSGKTLWALTEADFRKLLNDCAPPTNS